ncbi:MAG: hypothetical protein H0V89_14005 [Deltaproteobacteria bacterium]|nr:hypothetical protein [Deltaproteobacteria bacterium]
MAKAPEQLSRYNALVGAYKHVFETRRPITDADRAVWVLAAMMVGALRKPALDTIAGLRDPVLTRELDELDALLRQMVGGSLRV